MTGGRWHAGRAGSSCGGGWVRGRPPGRPSPQRLRPDAPKGRTSQPRPTTPPPWRRKYLSLCHPLPPPRRRLAVPLPSPFPKTHLCVLQCASLSPQPRQVGHVFLVPFPEQRPQLAQRDMLHVIDLLGLQAVRMPRQFLSQGHREHVVELVVHKGLAVKLPLFPVVV